MGRVRTTGSPSPQHVYSHAKHRLVDISLRGVVKAKEDESTASSSSRSLLNLFRKWWIRTPIVSFGALPPEIWVSILAMVNEDLFYPYKSITSDTFASFMLSTRWSGAPPIGIEDWRNLRLVCRQFNAIVGGASYARITHDQKAPDPNEVKALSVGARMEGRTVDLLEQHIFVRGARYNALATLDVTITASMHALLQSHGLDGANYCFQRLFIHAKALPNLKALYLDSCRRTDIHMDDFWFRLERAFPNLILFSLCNTGSRGKQKKGATFRNLETLALYEFPCTLSGVSLTFPALRHLSVATPPDLRSAFWMTHGPQLESLMIPSPNGFSKGLFDAAHNLRLLGVTWASLRDREFSGFPTTLEHLSVSRLRASDETIFSNDRDVKLLAEKLKETPRIRKLTIYSNKPILSAEKTVLVESLKDGHVQSIAMPTTFNALLRTVENNVANGIASIIIGAGWVILLSPFWLLAAFVIMHLNSPGR